jgi:predicted NAD-dependent protein-ADP-ribosyltransferase YbiA (DUF1768 family)
MKYVNNDADEAEEDEADEADEADADKADEQSGGGELLDNKSKEVIGKLGSPNGNAIIVSEKDKVEASEKDKAEAQEDAEVEAEEEAEVEAEAQVETENVKGQETKEAEKEASTNREDKEERVEKEEKEEIEERGEKERDALDVVEEAVKADKADKADKTDKEDKADKTDKDEGSVAKEASEIVVSEIVVREASEIVASEGSVAKEGVSRAFSGKNEAKSEALTFKSEALTEAEVEEEAETENVLNEKEKGETQGSGQEQGQEQGQEGLSGQKDAKGSLKQEYGKDILLDKEPIPETELIDNVEAVWLPSKFGEKPEEYRGYKDPSAMSIYSHHEDVEDKETDPRDHRDHRETDAKISEELRDKIELREGLSDGPNPSKRYLFYPTQIRGYEWLNDSSSYPIRIKDRSFPTVEHYIQFMKFFSGLSKDDRNNKQLLKDTYDTIVNVTPSEARAMTSSKGSLRPKMSNFVDKEWNKQKSKVVYYGRIHKILSNPNLRERLMRLKPYNINHRVVSMPSNHSKKNWNTILGGSVFYDVDEDRWYGGVERDIWETIRDTE